MDTNLEYYKVFYYVACSHSISQAAKALSISQPAVSQAMKQLEKSLGAKLFVRFSRGIRLTPEGEILFGYVKNGYEQIVLGEQVLARLMNLESGEIRIGASDMTLEFYLLPYLEQFHQDHPNIKVMVTNGPTPETLAYLQEGKIDFGIVTRPFEADEKISIACVRMVEDVFVAGRRFTHLKNHMLEVSSLTGYPIISLEKNTSTRTYIDEVLREHGVVLRPEFELATSDMIVQFALRNLGIGSVVKDFAMPFLESGKLFELRFKQMIPKREMCVVTNNQLPRSRAADQLISYLRNNTDYCGPIYSD